MNSQEIKKFIDSAGLLVLDDMGTYFFFWHNTEDERRYPNHIPTTITNLDHVYKYLYNEIKEYTWKAISIIEEKE